VSAAQKKTTIDSLGGDIQLQMGIYPVLTINTSSHGAVNTDDVSLEKTQEQST
jgi:hypothetical protein